MRDERLELGRPASSPPPPPPPPPSSNGSRTFTFANHCGYDVWVGGEGNPVAPPVHCSAGCPGGTVCNTANQLCTWIVPSASDWHVAAGQTMALALPPAWGGRFWPRTECSTANGRTTCATGDCAAEPRGAPVGVGGRPPATLAEFTVTPPSGGSDFYDVSNVDGSNVPLAIAPTAGTFDSTAPAGSNGPYYCGSPGCTGNAAAPCRHVLVEHPLQEAAPRELQDQDPGHYVGCRSANQVCAVDPGNPTLDCANEDDLYGCTGGGPNGVSGSCYSQGANGNTAAAARAGRPRGPARARTRAGPRRCAGRVRPGDQGTCVPLRTASRTTTLTSTFDVPGLGRGEPGVHHHIPVREDAPRGRPGQGGVLA